MRISACSGVGYGGIHHTNFSSAPKKGNTHTAPTTNYDTYGEYEAPDVKRLSVMVGMTSLAIMSFLLALSGKICNCARV